MVGQTGVHGHFAASLVELVLRSAPETARSQFQVMAGKNAKEKHRKSINVTRIPARVSTSSKTRFDSENVLYENFATN